MTRKITKTINDRQFTLQVLNVKERKVEEMTVSYNGTIAVGEAVKTLRRVFDTQDVKVVKILHTEQVAGLYEMDESLFFVVAQRVDRRKQGNYIARTITFHDLTIIGVNDNGEVVNLEWEVSGDYKEAEVIESIPDIITGAIVSDTVREELYMMSDKDFARLGRKVVKETQQG